VFDQQAAKVGLARGAPAEQEPEKSLALTGRERGRGQQSGDHRAARSAASGNGSTRLDPRSQPLLAARTGDYGEPCPEPGRIEQQRSLGRGDDEGSLNDFAAFATSPCWDWQ
jgi:hypothetical protein